MHSDSVTVTRDECKNTQIGLHIVRNAGEPGYLAAGIGLDPLHELTALRQTPYLDLRDGYVRVMSMTHLPEIGAENRYRFLTRLPCSLVPNFSYISFGYNE